MLAPTLRQPVLFPTRYGVYLTLAAMDILLTWLVLGVGGSEANAVAAWVINAGGLPGMTFFKFASVVIVLLICEYVGRKERDTAQTLTLAAVAISLIPIVIATIELASAAQPLCWRLLIR